MSNLPNHVTPEEQAYIKRCMEERDDAAAQFEQLKQALRSAEVVLLGKEGAVSSWTGYLFDKYGLSPQDKINVDGTIERYDNRDSQATAAPNVEAAKPKAKTS